MKRWVSFGCGPEKVGIARVEMGVPTFSPPTWVHPIRFGAYNIHGGRTGELDSALRGMFQANIDMGIFQETKVTAGIYMRESSGYRVAELESPSAHSGGVTVFFARRITSVEAL